MSIAQGAEIEPPALHRACAEVLHQDVRSPGHALHEATPRLPGKVDDDTAFAPIAGEEVSAATVRGERRPPAPGRIPPWRLDLDDVGPKVDELLGGKRARQNAGKVEDADTGERRAQVLVSRGRRSSTRHNADTTRL